MKNELMELVKGYAKVAVKLGVNLQEGKELVLSSPIECAYFARMIADEAYKSGAKEVITLWSDGPMTKLKFEYAHDDVFKEVPDWVVEQRLMYAKRGASFISITGEDPDLLKGASPEKLRNSAMSSGLALKEFYDYTMGNICSWLVIACPTENWAKKVFPNKDNPVEDLWYAILKASRVLEGDSVENWNKHKSNLKKWHDFLNKKQFSYLHFENSLGTDFKIGLPENHIWAAGADYTQDGIEFIANIPTEEVFTAPHKNIAEGRVVSSMPLSYQGNLIEDFELTFKDGQVVEYKAKKGYDSLANLLESFDGAKRLGEVALVPYNSPISNMGIIFYNTLFDENASCHLALGKAYPTSIKDGENMSQEELDKKGINESLTHVDFMIGSACLKVTAYDEEGKATTIIENGEFVGA